MKKRNLFVTLLCLVAIVMGLKLNAFADLGNFNDYSSGGSSYGSDYSGGGYSSGGSYGGGYYYYSDSDDSDITGSDIILTIIVIGIVLFISYVKTKNSKNSSPSTTGVIPTIQNHTDEIVNAITKTDPNFSSEKFIGWVKEVFITLQNAWSERDFEKVCPFEKEELYKNSIQN